MTIMWETAHACRGIVRYGLDAGCEQEVREAEPRTIHEVTLTGLEGDMLYSYSTLSAVRASPPRSGIPSQKSDIQRVSTACKTRFLSVGQRPSC